MKTFEKANAKINLFLDVVGKMDNGFHEIRSIMHSVTLCDSISVERFSSSESRISIYVKGKYFLPRNNKNLAYRAAELFSEALQESLSVRIGVQKRIPVAAGLAGGSSDAAAVLKALNRMTGYPFTREMLCKIGEALGSDVPYCILGKTQLCEGRGEKMQMIPFKKKLNFVVAIGDEHVSTAVAYSKLDEMYGDFKDADADSVQKYNALMEAIAARDERGIAANMYNIFESAVVPMCPEARAIKEKMLENGALGAMMSGSGPSVFGIFESREKAEEVAAIIGENAFAVTSV